MGLSLNIDMAAAAFIEPLPVIEFIAQILGKDVLSRQLSDSDRIKVHARLDELYYASNLPLGSCFMQVRVISGQKGP